MHRLVKVLAGVACATAIAAPVAANPLPDLRASTALVMESDSGRVLFAKNVNSVLPIASITKLMTALVVLDANLDLHEVVEVMEEDQSRLKFSRSRLPIGTMLTRTDLLRLALIASDNRAAAALARTYPGGTANAVEAMNAKARLLGLEHTRFEEPTGLSSHNVSSAGDLAKLVAAARGNALIREFSTTPEFELHTSHGPVAFRNTNSLLRREVWDIELSKTGFITEAGRCLVLSVRLAARPLTIVLLDAAGRYTHLADAQRIREWLDPSYTATVDAPPPQVHRRARVAVSVRHAAAHGRAILGARRGNPGRLTKKI